MKKKRDEIEDLRKQQAAEAEEERKRKEKEKKQLKQTQHEWLKAGIDTKAKINKSLDVNQKDLVSKAKGQAMSDCISLWNGAAKAGDYDKKGYMLLLRGITGVDDPKYDILVQINAAVNNNKNWSVLQGMIECLL